MAPSLTEHARTHTSADETANIVRSFLTDSAQLGETLPATEFPNAALSRKRWSGLNAIDILPQAVAQLEIMQKRAKDGGALPVPRRIAHA